MKTQFIKNQTKETATSRAKSKNEASLLTVVHRYPEQHVVGVSEGDQKTRTSLDLLVPRAIHSHAADHSSA